MLKIGEFSTLAQVSIRTLRHYDEVGLLKPMHVETESGYRYYSVIQLPRLHRILALRDLGFPLERIAEALEEGITAAALRGMLILRRAEQEEQLQEEQERLQRLKALLHLIDQEGRMTNDVILKNVPGQWIVSLRENIPAYRAVGQLLGKLYGTAASLASQGPGVVLLHDTEYRETNVDVEAAICVKHHAPVDEPLRCYQLPPATVASVVHHGAFNRIAEAYADLLRWVEANRYHPCGPTREIFLHVAQPVTRDDSSNVTEIQVPVETLD
ncbi:MAG TPA: MerR family transcriptional regulator [Terracidiphilus sp.]|nr:MerR family transcriptional regulator [Terracidiphilus sp.]